MSNRLKPYLTYIPISRFTMSVNFTDGTGTISYTHLTGDLVINLADGVFTKGTKMSITENNQTKATELYGTIHSTDATGVSGVLHETANNQDKIGLLDQNLLRNRQDNPF